MISDFVVKIWAVCPEGRFRFKEWPDDDAVVYDELTGNTHIVDMLAMELLHLLQHGVGLGVDALVANLREVFDNEPDSAIAARVERGLSRLRDIGLVAGQPR